MPTLTESQLRKIIREGIINEMIPRKVDRVQQTSMPKQDIVQTQEQISKSDPRWRKVRTWLGKDEYRRRYFMPEQVAATDMNNRFYWRTWDPTMSPPELVQLSKKVEHLFTKPNGVKDTFMRMVIAADKFGFESKQFQSAFDANTAIVSQIEPIIDEVDSIADKLNQDSIARSPYGIRRDQLIPLPNWGKYAD